MRAEWREIIAFLYAVIMYLLSLIAVKLVCIRFTYISKTIEDSYGDIFGKNFKRNIMQRTKTRKLGLMNLINALFFSGMLSLFYISSDAKTYTSLQQFCIRHSMQNSKPITSDDVRGFLYITIFFTALLSGPIIQACVQLSQATSYASNQYCNILSDIRLNRNLCQKRVELNAISQNFDLECAKHYWGGLLFRVVPIIFTFSIWGLIFFLRLIVL